MTDYGTIRIPRDEYEKHNERREKMGVTWAEYIDGQAPEGLADEIAEELKGEISMTADPTVQPNTEEMMEKVDEILSLTKENSD